jgi:raffinose/stachyose/melibiose transport system substrate-binding protein
MKKTRISAAKVSATLLSAALVTALAACAPSGDGGNTIVIWDNNLLGKTNDDGTVADNSFLDAAAQMFEDDNPGVNIEIVQQSGDFSADAAQFEAASIAGNGPDIRIAFTGGGILSFSDFYVDLADVFGQEVRDDLTGWNTVQEGYAEDGKVLALPYGSGTYFVVFYNKELLTAAGLDADPQPASWEEMMDLGQQYKDATGAPAFWVANLEGYVGAWAMGALVGGELGASGFTDMFNGDEPIDGEPMIKSYQAWSDLYASGLTNPDAGELSNGDATTGFVQGNAPFFFTGMWDDVNMTEAFGDQVGSFFIPVLDGAQYTSVAAGGPVMGLSITNYSKHQEVAKDFLRFLADPAMQDKYVEMTQAEASNSKSADPSVIVNPLLQQQAAELAQTDQLVYPFDNVMPQAVIDLFYRLNASVFLGTVTPEDAAAQLQAAYDAEQ